MAKKFTQLVGRTEIIAAIYNPEHLPTAVISLDPKSFSDPRPFCLHCLRHEDLSFFENSLIKRYANDQGLDARKQGEEIKAVIWPFFEDYANGGHACNGCVLSDSLPGHRIADNEQYCTMSTEQCA